MIGCHFLQIKNNRVVGRGLVESRVDDTWALRYFTAGVTYLRLRPSAQLSEYAFFETGESLDQFARVTFPAQFPTQASPPAEPPPATS